MPERLVSPLLGMTVCAAVVEFWLIRFFLRIGGAMPASPSAMPFYKLVELLGITSLNLAVLGSAVLIVISVADRFRLGSREVWFGLVLLAGLLVNVMLGGVLAIIPAPESAILHSTLSLAAIGAVLVRQRQASVGRMTWLLVALAQGFALYYVVTQGAAGLGIPLPGGAGLLSIAEAIAVIVPLTLPWSFRPTVTRPQIVAGVAVGTMFMLVYQVQPWMTSIMTMWTVTFSLFVPSPIVALSLGTAVTCLLALSRNPATRRPAAGLLLVMLAGLKLDYTYFTLLSMTGLLVMADVLPASDTDRSAAIDPSKRTIPSLDSQNLVSQIRP